MRLMGLDMGTSGCKAVVFDENWNIVCDAYREYPLCFPGEGLLELDPRTVWGGIVQVIREVNEKTDQDIDALAVSAIGDVILPLTSDGEPVRDAIVDFDPRGKAQIESFTEAFGIEDFYRITGMPPLFIGSLAKILWIKQNEPLIYSKVERWGTFEDYIVQKLGLPPSVSYSEAARTMLFDIRSKQWAPEVLAAVPIEQSMLPNAVKSGTKLGTVGKEIAQSLGFAQPPAVVSGGHDMVCAAIGAGLDERSTDTAVNIAGTIEGIVVAMDSPNTSATMLESRFPCYPGYDGYVTFSVNLTAGCILRWYRDVIAKDTYLQCKEQGHNIFDILLESLNTQKPGGMLLLPHFSGSGNPYFNPEAKGVLYGMTLDSTRDDLVQAMIEGLYYEQRLHVEAFARAGIDIRTLRAVGGGARTDVQLQMKANITGLDVVKGSVVESSALGAAAIAGVSIGVIAHPCEAYKAAAHGERQIKMDAAAHQRFENTYKSYAQLCRIINDFES